MPARPIKIGGNTQYVDEVASGYPELPAKELDDDFNVVYASASTLEDAIREMAAGQVVDGSITTAKLADSSVTSAKIVDGSIATADLANGSVTDAKIVGVSWSKVTGAPVTPPPPTGLTPTRGSQIWQDPVAQAPANVTSAYILDARNLVLADGHTYRVTLVGDISRIANGSASLVITTGGVNSLSYTVGGPAASAMTEVFTIDLAITMQGTAMRIACTVRVAAPGTLGQISTVTSTLIVSKTVTSTGPGIAVQASWDTANAGNNAHTTVGLVECI
jgi:hypothetical protein